MNKLSSTLSIFINSIERNLSSFLNILDKLLIITGYWIELTFEPIKSSGIPSSGYSGTLPFIVDKIISNAWSIQSSYVKTVKSLPLNEKFLSRSLPLILSPDN